jgi:hypothetical protein
MSDDPDKVTTDEPHEAATRGPDPAGAPVLAGAGDATREQQIAGVVEQVRWDVAHHLASDGPALLTQRLDEVGLEVDRRQREQLVARLDPR